MPVVPSAINISSVKPSMDAGVTQSYTRHDSNSSSAGEGSTIVINIPTGGRPRFLLPAESYLTFSIVPNFTGPLTGKLYLDGSAHSFFRNLRIYHGDELVSTNNYPQLANYLIDYNMSASDKDGAGTAMGCGTAPFELVHNVKATFAIPLFAPILGLFTDHGIPLSWMGSTNLRLELDLAPFAQVYTSSPTLVIDGTATGLTGASYEMSDIAYLAKNCIVSQDINNGLIGAFAGDVISFPSTAFANETAQISAGSKLLNTKVSMQYGSLKNVVWWTQAQNIYGGIADALKFGRPASSRYLPALANWYLNIGGEQVPSYRITGMERTYMETLRVFDKTSMPIGIAFPRANFIATGADTAAEQRILGGKAAAGIDLESSDDQANVFCGRNTTNDQLSIVAEFEAGLGEASIVHIFGQYDVLYSLENGQLRRKA